MRSLRSRLIVGSALIALVPLAAGMELLSRRIASTVRGQAEARLEASLGSLREQLVEDATRVQGQLRILGRDPALKRLLLLRPAGDRDLSGYLAQQRYLLGLDFLSVTDTAGALVADAAALATETRADEDAWRTRAAGVRDDGPAIEPLGSAELVLDARAPIPYEALRAGTLVGGRALDAATLARLRRTSGMELTLRDAQGRAVASTLAADSAAGTGSGGTGAATGAADPAPSTGWLARAVPLDVGPAPHPVLVGLVSTAAIARSITAARGEALLVAALALALAVLLGVVWSRQVSRPVERLAGYSQRLARGEWDEPLTLRSVRELETLVGALDHMRGELRAHRERLAVSERQAAWSQMARQLAHEVKNPLTPIAISVADLRRSYEQRRPDFPAILEQAARTVDEEVASLTRMVQEFSQFARLPAPRLQRVAAAQALAGLRSLYAGEVAAGRLAVADADPAWTIQADPEQLRQALVNLVQNGLDASGEATVRVAAAAADGALELSVADTGPGLSDEQRAQLFVPGFTTKPHGSGLGLTIVQRIVSDHGGTIEVSRGAQGGTTFRVRLPLEADAGAEPARSGSWRSS